MAHCASYVNHDRGNSQDLTSRVALVHTETQKTFIASSQYHPSSDALPGRWILMVGSLKDPQGENSDVIWWGMDLDREELVQMYEEHHFGDFKSLSEAICSIWDEGSISISPYKPGKWQKAFINFDAGTERAISIPLVKLDQAQTPRLAMDLCFSMAAKLHHSSSSSPSNNVSESAASAPRALPNSFETRSTMELLREIDTLKQKCAQLQEENRKRAVLNASIINSGGSSSAKSPKKQHYGNRIKNKPPVRSASTFKDTDYEEEDED